MSTPPFYVDGAGGDRWGDGEQDEVGRKLSFEVFLCFASSSRASSFLKLADASGTRRQSAGGSVRPWASRPSTSMWSIPSLLTTSSSSLIMPLCSLHLLSLSCAPRDFLGQLRGKRNVILASQPHSPPVIRVGEHDGARINGTQWHLLVVLDKDEGALREDEALGGSIKEELVLTTGIPSKLIESYKERRGKLVKDEGPPLVYNVVRSSSSTSSSSSSQTITPSRDSQNLELSNDLVKFAHRLRSEEGGTGPVWMLNLLKFKEGKKEEYIKYGQAFAKVAPRFGGTVVLVGSIASPSSPTSSSYWDEFALAHYPSINHFVDMSADGSPGGYQEINRRWRLGSLEDTGILCTTPLMMGEGKGKARL